MNNRRNSIVNKDQYQNGIRVGTVFNINGRFPAQGLHSDCAKNLIFYVMKGSGMIGHADKKTGATSMWHAATNNKSCKLTALVPNIGVWPNEVYDECR